MIGLDPNRRALLRCVLLLCGAAAACLTRAQSDPRAGVEIPIELRRGDLLAKARLNGSEPLTFDLDTASGVTTVQPGVARRLMLERAGRMTIIGIAGEEEATTYRGAIFDFGGVTYSPRRVAALPSEARRGRPDGTLGAGFFRRFVVEIDPGARAMRLFEPARFTYSGPGERLAVRIRGDSPVIRAAVIPSSGRAVEGQFVLDTGCDGYVCLERTFVEANRLLEKSGALEEGARSGIGGQARVRTAKLEKIQIGSFIVERPEADFFMDGSPAQDDLAGHFGMATLGQFKMILDYSRKQLIIEKSTGNNRAR